MPTLPDRIRSRIAELGTTQAEVSERITNGASKNFLSNIMLGRSTNPRSDTMEKIAKALDTSVEWLLYGDGNKSPVLTSPPAPNVRLADVKLPFRHEMEANIGVRGTAAGSLGEGAFHLSTEPVDYVLRPPGLIGAKEAYAFYVEGYSMEPAHRHGDLRFAHPKRKILVGDDVILFLQYHEQAEPQAYIKRVVKRGGGQLTVQQFNPEATIVIDERYIVECHKVLTMADLFGV